MEMVENKTIKNCLKCTFSDCRWEFDSKYKLQRHMRSHSKEKPFKCELCGKSFSHKYNMKFHSKSHHSMEKHCKKALKLVNASRDVEQKCLLECPRNRCLKRFDSQEELQEHIDNHDKQYKCSFQNCEKRFRRPSLLKQHLLIHAGTSLFVCDEVNCQKMFVKKQSLIHHKLLHDNKKGFACSVKSCGKRFNTKFYLNSHQRTHERKDKYMCPFETCCKSFVCKQTLEVHLKAHSNIRPYICTHVNCNKSYLTLSNLKSHQKIHDLAKDGKASNDIENIGDIETNLINVNDFINISLLEGKTKTNKTNVDQNTLSKEDLLAAAFGEVACNEYINDSNMKFVDQSLGGAMEEGIDSKVPTNDFDESTILRANNENFQTTFIEDIQFQEEFASNIYLPLVSNYRKFISGHDYEQSGYYTPSNVTLSPQEIEEVDEFTDNSSLGVNDIDYISETSMELSTGHLEIDGGYLGSSLCMPDHVYSHQICDSSVNSSNVK